MTANYRQIPDLLRARVEFDGNSMHAERVRPGGHVRTGFLSPEDTAVLDHAWKDAAYFGETLYVVYSYGTPIAWGLDGRKLTVPDTRYSRTTSRHQTLARAEA